MSHNKTAIILLVVFIGIAVVTSKKSATRAAYCKNGLDKYDRLCANPSLSEKLRRTFADWCAKFKKMCNSHVANRKASGPKKAAQKKKPKNSAAKPEAKGRNPEQELKKCCTNHKGIPKSCKSLCSFKKLNRNTFEVAFLRGACPGNSPRHVINCASFGVDHTQCCEAKGVDVYAGGICKPFCNPTMPGQKMDMGIGSLPCLDIFPKISQCYQQGMPRD